MVERVAEPIVGQWEMFQDRAEDYWGLGGKLCRASFEEAKSAQYRMAYGREPMPVRESSALQAEGMAGFAGVTLTPEQLYVYAVLRETMRKPGWELPYSTKDGQGTAPAWTMSDQRLLSEVFLLTGDPQKRRKLEEAYPNIFPEE